MKNHSALLLIVIALLLLVSSAAGSARAARLMLQIMPVWELYPGVTEQGVRMGCGVAGAGQVNGDSYADVLVGAENGGTDKQGWAGVYLGSAGGPQSNPVWTMMGERRGDRFGSALDGAGDVNNDGYADIIIGAYQYQGEAPSDEAQEGAAYVYYGGASGPGAIAAWKVEGDLQGAGFGAAVAGAGYVNGDAYADVIVGMPGYANGDKTNAGAAFVYFGSADGPEMDYGWLDIGEQANAQFGLEVNGAGDVNGDGYEDVLVGQPYYDNITDVTYADAGAVYLYLGNQYSLSNVHAWSYIGYRGGDWLGTSAAGVGDVNGDGYDDIAVGAPGYNVGSEGDAGRVYVFYGGPSGLSDEPDWEFSITPAQAGALLGYDVSGGGDTNGDGYDDLLVGAKEYDDEQAGEGVVYAFFGGPGGLGDQPDWQAEGNKNDTDFGYAIDGAEDTNNDGYADVLIGAPTYRVNEIVKGAAFVYLGSQQAIIHHINLPFIRK